MPSGPLIFKRLKKKEEKNEFMFRVIRMMNSAGPGATSVKKKKGRDGGRGRRWQESETETDRLI